MGLLGLLWVPKFSQGERKIESRMQLRNSKPKSPLSPVLFSEQTKKGEEKVPV